MKNESILDIFDRFSSLEDCVIEEIKFSKFGSIVEISINNIWKPSLGRTLRENLDDKHLLKFKFTGLRRFSLINNTSDLNYEQTIELFENIDWGYNEISHAVYSEKNGLKEVIFFWELNTRQLEISFLDFEFSESAVSSL